MTSVDDPAVLLAAARSLLGATDAQLAATSPRATAHLARQSLEGALDQLWRVKAPALLDVSRHAQLICLPGYLPDRRLAHQVRYTWAALSRACHHHAYELSPSASELARWFACIEALIELLGAATKPSS